MDPQPRPRSNNRTTSDDSVAYNDQRPSSHLDNRSGSRPSSTFQIPVTVRTSLYASTFGDTLNGDASRGVQLVEVIAPGATPLQRKNGSSASSISRPGVASPATLHPVGGTSSIARGQMGTLRTMSMRGKKPTRVIRNLVVNKTDAKSYFSTERTMYAWMYVGTIILGISLTIYRYIGEDEKLALITIQTGTLLSGLSLVVVYYAAVHFFWRQRALNRGREAQAFDDKLGPILVVALLVTGLTAYIMLTWIDPIPGLQVKLHKGSFWGRAGDAQRLANGTRVKP